MGNSVMLKGRVRIAAADRVPEAVFARRGFAILVAAADRSAAAVDMDYG